MTFKGTPPVTFFLHKIPPNKVSRTSQKRLWRIFHFEAIAKSLCTCPPLQEQLAWWCIADGNVWVTAEHSTSCWWAVHPSQRTGSQARVRSDGSQAKTNLHLLLYVVFEPQLGKKKSKEASTFQSLCLPSTRLKACTIMSVKMPL